MFKFVPGRLFGGLIRGLILGLILGPISALAPPAAAEDNRAYRAPPALEAKWRTRIQSFLDRGILPLIDLETSLPRKRGERYLAATLPVMDELGLALMATEGKQAKKRADSPQGYKGYRWSGYVRELAAAHPDRFVAANDGGSNKNWTTGKDSFIAQTEDHVRAGRYAIMGEFEFRHYMSQSQCKSGKTHRDVSLPVNGANGRRLFRLSSETGIAFVIHLDPEDAPLAELEEMLKAYPGATVINAHFGQLRHPEKQRKLGPALVRRLLTTYPNLYYDISTGYPGRRYRCNDWILDTVLWQSTDGGQSDRLKPEYKAILTEFSSRFVAATDYGGGRAPWPRFLRRRVENLRRILGNLPQAARHDIAYRNAWSLLTGKTWAGTPSQAVMTEAAAVPSPYTGPISDAHGHLDGKKADPEALISAMQRNRVAIAAFMPKRHSGWSDADALDLAKQYPDRVVPAIGFQNLDWRKHKGEFMTMVAGKARSGRFGWIGEVSFRGKIGGKLHAATDTPHWPRLQDLAAETGLPVTVHHNPWQRPNEHQGGGWRRTGEFESFAKTLGLNPKAKIIWAHWCGLNSPDETRRLLDRYSNLHCDLAWITKDQSGLPNPLLGPKRDFTRAWTRLLEDKPDRFLIGIDVGGKPGQMRKYDRRMKLIRCALGGLSSKAAALVAGGNFRRLAGPIR